MKKTLITTIVAGILVFAVSAEEITHAIGIRTGKGTYGSGFEFSYEEYTDRDNRIEIGIGVCDQFGVAAVYKWVKPVASNLYWFAGPGAQVRFLADEFGWGIGGQAGAEYLLELGDWPILIGFDVRPMWGSRDTKVGENDPDWQADEDVYHTGTGFTFDGALSLRYAF